MTDLETRIRAALEHRAESTHASPFEDAVGLPLTDADIERQPTTDGRFASASTQRRWMSVAAAAVVVVGGLVAVASLRHTPSPNQQSAPVDVRFGIDIDDPTTIDLDEWIDAGTALAVDQRYLVLDERTLPAGVEITSAFSTTTSFGPLAELGQPPSYTYQAVLGFDGVDWFDVVVDENRGGDLVPAALNCDTVDVDDPVDVNGVQAATDGTSVCWTNADDVVIRVTSIAPPGVATDALSAVSLANSITLTTVDELPSSEPIAGVGQPVDVAFAGQLAGVAWSADVRAGPLRRMDVYVNGFKASGIERTRDSQPTDDEVAVVRDDTIAGVPGFGVIAYGTASPTIEHVIVTHADGRRARLPVVQRELETYFAVPIPDSVTVDWIQFVDGTGTAVEVLRVPVIPPGLDGSFGGMLTTNAGTRSNP